VKHTAGTVYLVGAGPGDPELITVRGANLLREADVVVHDRLVSAELLSLAPLAEHIDVGKSRARHAYSQGEINDLLIDRAGRGACVVRLKGGDPFVFGRGGEEAAACKQAGVACVVVPGVTSAVAGPGAAGIPVTHRGLSRSLAIVTASIDASLGQPRLDYDALSRMDTIVIMMGRAGLAEVAAKLISAGRDPETLAACIENATTPDQRTVSGTLATIARLVDSAGMNPPIVTIIGPTVALAD
jgi:uroporphyrin-III C-methyltransferase